MNTVDMSPLFRTAIGFDRLVRTLETARNAADTGYPPYNIETTGDDAYVLTMAVAGFAPNDLDIVVRDNTLTIAGRAPQAADGRTFVHRGIAARAFERRFILADHIVVVGSALENGLLQLALKREVPEALKPRRIPVQTGRIATPGQVTNDAAPQAAAA